MAFTTAELADIRRFCGYPPASVTGNYLPMSSAGILAAVLDRVGADVDEAAIVRTIYLARLTKLETDIADQSSDNLDADALPGGYKHNANEVRDREGLYLSYRRKLAQFLGVTTGPYLSVFIPAAFVV